MKKSKPVDMARFKHLYPFGSKFMSINGFRYHYIDEGSGEPMVMIHGNPTWSFYYRALIRAFSSRFRTIAMDHIGCGLSEKPPADRYDYTLQHRIDDLTIFLEQMVAPTQKITLVLHDWGGMIGMAYALQHLDRIQRLVVLNTAAFLPPSAKPIPLRLRLIRNLDFFSTVSVLGLNIFARGALLMASNKKLSPDVQAGLIAPYNCWQNRIATLMFVKDIPLKKTDFSYQVVRNVDQNLFKLRDIPMLICWGMKDFVFDNTYLAEWRKRFPGAIVHKVEDAGHYILEDAPQNVIDCLRSFMLS
jgi:pimeloyl-ACP methyl ester carboxylesterase